MDRLIQLLKEFLVMAAAFVSGYVKGKNDTTQANTQAENEKLAEALNSVLNNDYSPNAVRKRMRDSKPDE